MSQTVLSLRVFWEVVNDHSHIQVLFEVYLRCLSRRWDELRLLRLRVRIRMRVCCRTVGSFLLKHGQVITISRNNPIERSEGA
jgi:hypothetical protein